MPEGQERTVKERRADNSPHDNTARMNYYSQELFVTGSQYMAAPVLIGEESMVAAGRGKWSEAGVPHRGWDLGAPWWLFVLALLIVIIDALIS